MSLFLNPTGKATFGIGLCARCSRKMFLSDLHPDPNSPGLMVCEEDLDVLDPYRLPARPPDNIVLPYVRPDVSIAVTAATTPAPSPGTPYTLWASDLWADDLWADGLWS